MKKIKEAIEELLDAKSIVTIIFTIAFLVMVLRGTLTPEFQGAYLVMVAFYFGTLYQKAIDIIDFHI